MVDSASSPSLWDEVAVAARHGVPFVIVVIEDGRAGIDHITLMAAFACPARRVERPGEIADALGWASATAETTHRPVLVEIMVDRAAEQAERPAHTAAAAGLVRLAD